MYICVYVCACTYTYMQVKQRMRQAGSIEVRAHKAVQQLLNQRLQVARNKHAVAVRSAAAKSLTN